MNSHVKSRSSVLIGALLTVLTLAAPSRARAEVLTQTFSGVINLLDGDVSGFFDPGMPDGAAKPGVCVQIDTNTLTAEIVEADPGSSFGLAESPNGAGSTQDGLLHPSGFNQRRIMTAYNPGLAGGTIYIGIDLPGGTGSEANREFDNGAYGGVFTTGQVLPFDADGNGHAEFIGVGPDMVTPFSACPGPPGSLLDVWLCTAESGSAGALDNPRGGYFGEEEFYNAVLTFGGGQQVSVSFVVGNETPADMADFTLLSALPFTGSVSSSTGGTGVPQGFDVVFAIANVNAAVPNECDRLSQHVVVRSGSNTDGSGQGEDVNELTCQYVLPPCLQVTKSCEPAAFNEPVQFSGGVTNCGQLTLTGVLVVDDHAGVVLGPISLLPGQGAAYEGSYFPDACATLVTNTVTAMGTACTGQMLTNSATDICVIEPPVRCLEVVKNCEILTGDCTTVQISGYVTNCGTIGLVNVMVVDDQAGLLLGPISLDPGEAVAFNGSHPAIPGQLNTDTATATGTDVCGNEVMDSDSASCFALCPDPCITVLKTVACLLPGDLCGPFAKEAAGFKGMTDPAFCYSITISNCGVVPLTNVTVFDNQLGNLTPMFIGPPETVLPVGGWTNLVFKMAWGTTTTNTVTVNGTSTFDGAIVSDFDLAVAQVKEASVTCELIVQSPFDLDGNPADNKVQLPIEMGSYPVTYSVIVCNTGESGLANVTIDASGLAPLDCEVPVPFSLLPGECRTNILCEVELTCDDRPLIAGVEVEAEVDTSGGECGYDINGTNITVESACVAMVNPCDGDPCLDVIKDADKTVVLPGESVTYTYTVTNCGMVTLEAINVVDDNGTPGFPGDDFVVGFIDSLDPGQTRDFSHMLVLPVTICSDGTGVETGMLIAQVLPGGNIGVTFIQSMNVNDNTYGVNAIGWGGPNKHSFKNLVGSDKAEFELRNGNGQVSLAFAMDYISESGAFPSGYGSLGVTGGEGAMDVGSSASILEASTSLAENLNKVPFLNNLAQYTVDSPALADPASAEWEYRMIYSFVVDPAAFGPSGFGTVAITDQHNSPQKNAKFVPVPCESCVTNIVEASTVFGTNILVATDSEIVCQEQPCRECDGRVSKLTLQYNGAIANAMIRVEQKNGATVFNGVVQPGGQFMFVGTDEGTFGTEINVFVNGVENTAIHTSCSQPIGPGTVSGDFLVTEAFSLNGGRICDVDRPPDGCSECDGKVTKLTLEYTGGIANALIEVEQKNGVIVFAGIVQPGGSFMFMGTDNGTFGNEITIRVNGAENTRIHTSCSQPIGPGLVSGDFLVVEGFSKDGGLICDLDRPPDGCSECDGRVSKLTLQYTGGIAGALIRVEQKSGDIVFAGTVQPGEAFMFMGTDDGTFGTEITVFVNGASAVAIHTSCSQPIGPGMAFGDFLVIEGYSKDGGLICEIVRCAEDAKFWEKNPAEWPALYTPDQQVGTVFAKASSKAGEKSLRDALGGKAGSKEESDLLKHAVAGLLNASRPDFNYPLTAGEIVTGVDMALMSGKQAMKSLADLLEEANKEDNCEPRPRPCIEVTKLIACLLPGDLCGVFGKSATGYKGDTDPGFCYSITVKNCGPIALTNLSVIDDKLGDLTPAFFAPGAELLPGAEVTRFVKMAWGVNTLNTVTASGRGSTAGGAVVMDTDQAMAVVEAASLVCQIVASSPDDLDGDPGNGHVQLPEDGEVHPVTFTAIVCNTGTAPLANVSVGFGPLAGCVNPPVFDLAPGACYTNVLCEVEAGCEGVPLVGVMTVQAEVDTSAGGCGHDFDGEPVTIQTECEATVDCQPPDPMPGLRLSKVADQTTVEAGGIVTYTYEVENTGDILLTGLTIVDDNGTPGFPADDFVVASNVSLAPGEIKSYDFTVILPVTLCGSNDGLPSGMLIIEVLPDGNIKASFIQDTGVNDNTYGVNSIGWGGPNKHTFKNLVGSDKAEFEFRDGNGTVVLQFTQDYISASGAFPSGYGSLGVTGGEGKMVVGAASGVLSATTSLTENLNKAPFLGDIAKYTVDSPALADPESADWEYRMIYTVVVDKDVFGAGGYGGVAIVDQHNSPKKRDVQDPRPCDGCITNIATVTALAGPQVLTASASATVCNTDVPPPSTGLRCPEKADYWKKNTGLWPAPYAAGQSIGSLFVKAPGLVSGKTLLDAVSGKAGSGKTRDLLKEAVAGLLNASTAGVAYPFTVDDIILGVNMAFMNGQDNALSALKELLKEANDNGNCGPAGQVDNCTTAGRPNVLTLVYNGQSCAEAANSQAEGKTSCSGDAGDAASVRIVVSDSPTPPGAGDAVFFDGIVALNQQFEALAANAGEDKFQANTYVHIRIGQTVVQTIGIHTSCSAPLIRGETFGALTLEDYRIDP